MTKDEIQEVRNLVEQFQGNIIRRLEEAVQVYLKSQTEHLRERIGQQQRDISQLLAELLEYRKIQLQAEYEEPDSFLYAGDDPEEEEPDADR